MKNWLIIICLTLFVACKEEPKLEAELLDGDWVISEAMKNAHKTELLDGLLFSFNDELLTTNYTGDIVSEIYQIDGMKVKTSKDDMVYTVVSLDSQNLVLKTKVKNNDFLFTFKKVGQ